MNITDMVYIMTGFFEAIVSIMFINTYKRDEDKNHFKYIVSAAVLAVMINISNNVLNYGYMNMIFVLVSICIISFVFNGNLKTALMSGIMLVAVLMSTEITTLFIITYLSDITVEQATNIESYKILGMILSKLFAFFVIKFICIRHKENKYMKTTYQIFCFIMFAVSATAIYLLFIFQYHSTADKVYTNIAAWCSCGLLYSTFFSIYLYENIAKQAEIEKNQEIFRQEAKNLSKHINEVMIAQKEIKKLRHDLNNHCIAIQSFFENKDYEKGTEYIKTVSANSLSYYKMIETGNIVFDAILNAKKSIALNKGIKFEAKIQVPENLFIDPTDISVIFGNALDNAIEACERIKNGKKEINMMVVYDENALICKVMNTSVKSSNKFFVTTKRDKKNHGFGLDNIKNALEKYNGICKYGLENEMFTLSLVIFKEKTLKI